MIHRRLTHLTDILRPRAQMELFGNGPRAAAPSMGLVLVSPGQCPLQVGSKLNTSASASSQESSWLRKVPRHSNVPYAYIRHCDAKKFLPRGRQVIRRSIAYLASEVRLEIQACLRGKINILPILWQYYNIKSMATSWSQYPLNKLGAILLT